MTAKEKEMQSLDLNCAQIVEAEPASFPFLRAEKARVTRASLVSRDLH